MKTIAPLQVMNLVKSFIIFFLIPSVAWIVANLVAFRGMLTGIILGVVFMGNLMISGLVGWWWYKRNYHTTFSWDDQGFELQRGRGDRSSKEWQDFSQVSLVHEEHGRFVVRVYENGEEYIDIPASDLKLDPSDFRFEVMDLIRGRSPAEGLGSPGKEL